MVFLRGRLFGARSPFLRRLTFEFTVTVHIFENIIRFIRPISRAHCDREALTAIGYCSN